MPYASIHTLPFWLHSLIELTPSIVFFFNPAAQLYAPKIASDLQICTQCYSIAKSGAEALIRQYAVLIFVSVIVSTVFATHQVNVTSRQVAAALTLYHSAPVVRAASRLWAGERGWLANDMGGPWVHLTVHLVCFLALGNLALGLVHKDKHETVPRKEE